MSFVLQTPVSYIRSVSSAIFWIFVFVFVSLLKKKKLLRVRSRKSICSRTRSSTIDQVRGSQSTSLLMPHSQQNLAVSGNLKPHRWQYLDILHLLATPSPCWRLLLDRSSRSKPRPATSLALRPWCEYLRFKLGGRNRTGALDARDTLRQIDRNFRLRKFMHFSFASLIHTF